jgi:hypothetical protein
MENNNLTPEQEQELINKIEEKINNLGKWETHLDLMRGQRCYT